jgi:hypothetical protein
VSPRLSLGDDLPEERLKVDHVVVFELPDGRAREPNAEPDRRVVELVRDDEAALADERGHCRRVGRKAHRNDYRIILAEEPGDELLRLYVQVERTSIESGTRGRDTVPANGFFDSVGASSRRRGETKIVVRRDIERARLFTSLDERVVRIGRRSVVRKDRPSGDGRDRLGEAVVEPCLEATGVERVKV